MSHLEDGEDSVAVVIDCGSDSIKAGFAGDDAPRAHFPSIIGRFRYRRVMVMGLKDVYIGDEAVGKRGILNLKRPIERGIVTSWEDMAKILHHTFYDELRIVPEENPILLSEAVLNPKENREKMIQIMFETHNTPAVALVPQPVLALFAMNKQNGIVIDSGFRSTRIAAVYQGQVIKDTVHVLDVGGDHLTDYMMKLMEHRGYCFSTSAERDIVMFSIYFSDLFPIRFPIQMILHQVQDMKRQLGYIAYDYEAEVQRAATDSSIEKSYELPGGILFTIGSQRFQCTEPLFQPQLLNEIDLNVGEQGIHELVYETVLKCDANIRVELLKNIVVCGGNAKFNGMDKRLNKELQKVLFGRNVVETFLNVAQREDAVEKGLSTDIVELICKYEGIDKYKKLCDDYFTINVIIGTNDHFSTVWSGGSAMAMNKHFVQKWITKDEYDEHGPSIVYQK